jgi:hypothetical protein
MPPDPNIHRRQQGSIDLDSYRCRAVAERSSAIRDGRALRAALVGGLAMVGVLGLAIVLPSVTSGPMLAVAAKLIQIGERAGVVDPARSVIR